MLSRTHIHTCIYIRWIWHVEPATYVRRYATKHTDSYAHTRTQCIPETTFQWASQASCRQRRNRPLVPDTPKRCTLEFLHGEEREMAGQCMNLQQCTTYCHMYWCASVWSRLHLPCTLMRGLASHSATALPPAVKSTRDAEACLNTCLWRVMSGPSIHSKHTIC